MPNKKTRTAGTPWVKVGAGLLGRVTSAFAPKVERRQTRIMQKTGAVSVSAAALRARVNDLADHLAGRLEQAADRISREAQDPEVRRRALAFKVDAIPAVYTATYRADPLAAALDAWGLAFQIKDHFATGSGRDAFGPQQQLAQVEADAVVADVDALVKNMTTSPKRFAEARVKVERWARDHRIEHALSSRATVTPVLAEWRSEDRDAFLAVGEVTDTIQNLSERLNTYAAQLPRQARWQAELLVSETVEHDVPDLLVAAGSAVREVVAAERVATLSAIREEWTAVVAALRQERIETLAEVDAIQRRTVESVAARIRGLVDYTLWRVAALLALFLLLAATLGVVAYRLTAGRLG